MVGAGCCLSRCAMQASKEQKQKVTKLNGHVGSALRYYGERFAEPGKEMNGRFIQCFLCASPYSCMWFADPSVA